MKCCLTFSCCVFALIISTNAFSTLVTTDAGVTLDFDDVTGRLSGAYNVILGSSFYDVSFVEYTEVFRAGEDRDNWNFTFNNEIDASEASWALLDQVLIDDENLNLSEDSSPNVVDHSSPHIHNIGQEEYIITPYALWEDSQKPFIWELLVTVTVNTPSSSLGWDEVYATDGTAFDGAPSTWALWTPADSLTVPEPTTFLLLGTGLALLAGITGRKKKK